MDTDRVAKEIQSAIDLLKEERDDIDDKIAKMEEVLRSLGAATPGRRVKKKATKKKSASGRKKPHWSPEARQAAKERMIKYWESVRKQGGKKAIKKKATKKKAAKKKAAKKRVAKKSAASSASAPNS